ncbi:MAG: hypothetical protein N2Z62_07415 [Rhodobacteraceae bacterium]|nr:hypothetical protein [Paracoccaceae bacterium]
MDQERATDRLDRHVLVIAIWAPALFSAVLLLHRGIATGGLWWIAAGFAALLAAYAGHIVANAVLGTGFSRGEVALGAVVFALVLAALLLDVLVAPEGITDAVWPALALGMGALIAAVVIYLVIAHGPRRAFETFDVIRDNNPRPASRLRHRGGRR